MTQNLTAVLAALAGAFLWGIVWLPLARLTGLGITGLWATFLVFALIGGVGMIPAGIAFRRGRCRLRLLPAFLLVVFGGLTNLLFFIALTKTTVVRALMFFYLSPVWNLMGGRLSGKGRFTVRKILMVGVALAGTAILLGLHRNLTPQWNSGDTCALLSGIAFAISVVGLQMNPTVPSWILTVIHWLGTALTALIGIILLKPAAPNWSEAGQWLPLLLLFAVGIQATASLCILFSLTRLESYRVNILMLFEIVVATITAACWSNQVIAGHEWLGVGLILAASAFDNMGADQPTGLEH